MTRRKDKLIGTKVQALSPVTASHHEICHFIRNLMNLLLHADAIAQEELGPVQLARLNVELKKAVRAVVDYVMRLPWTP